MELRLVHGELRLIHALGYLLQSYNRGTLGGYGWCMGSCGLLGSSLRRIKFHGFSTRCFKVSKVVLGLVAAW